MADLLGATRNIEKPEEIREALERAQAKVNEGRVAVVNIKTDHKHELEHKIFLNIPPRLF